MSGKNQFVIFTTKYEAELRDFAATAAADDVIYIQESEKKKKKTTEDSGFSMRFSISQRDAFCETLLRFLMDIAENENPVYKHSPKLRAMASNLRSRCIFAKEKQRLGTFLRSSKQLVLEGYITFRMTEFCEKLDMMMYSLVKKIKFGARE